MDSCGKEECGISDSGPSMSPQQRRFSAAKGSRLSVYRDLIAGDKGWAYLIAFELYNVIAAPLGSLAGIALRTLTLPFFCKRFGKRTVVGKGVTFRQPGRVSIGKATIIDDHATIDVRSNPDAGKTAGIEIGDHVLIGRSTIVTTKGGTIKLGNAVNISSFCRIATRSSIEIGESVLVAAYSYIGCGNHTFEDTVTPIIEQEMDVRGGVKIGANSWIGAKVTILDGVTIGENAIIGAHSLVREDVPANAIAAGVPARIIRLRTETKQQREAAE